MGATVLPCSRVARSSSCSRTRTALGPVNRAALPYPRAAGVDIRLMVDDAHAVYASVRERGVHVVLPLKDQACGLRDFTVADPDGFRVRFAQRIA